MVEIKLFGPIFRARREVTWKMCRHAGEVGRGSRRPSCLSVGGGGGAKVPF